VIARLAGKLVEKSPERIVLDVQGVGYDVRVPLSTYAALPVTGESLQLLIHTHLREDALTLYGFSTPLERYLFEKMISVSGVGPRLALALLSGLSPQALTDAIRTGATSALCLVPGVGRKTAERLVVDLRDKISLAPAGARAAGVGKEAGDSGMQGEGAVLADVQSALVNLGYAARDAERALEEARKAVSGRTPSREKDASMTFEGLLREALRSAATMR